MPSDIEQEKKIAEYFLKSFEEKTPLDYDILDSMLTEENKKATIIKQGKA